jgi:hypothetical protein
MMTAIAVCPVQELCFLTSGCIVKNLDLALWAVNIVGNPNLGYVVRHEDGLIRSLLHLGRFRVYAVSATSGCSLNEELAMVQGLLHVPEPEQNGGVLLGPMLRLVLP